MDDTLRNRVAQAAEQARQWTEAKYKVYDCDDDMCGMCGVSTMYLSRLLKQENIHHNLCVADDRRHCFVVCEQLIVDVTATQFSEDRVVIVSAKDTDRDINRWYWKASHTFSSEQELRQHLIDQKWWEFRATIHDEQMADDLVWPADAASS